MYITVAGESPDSRYQEKALSHQAGHSLRKDNIT